MVVLFVSLCIYIITLYLSWHLFHSRIVLTAPVIWTMESSWQSTEIINCETKRLDMCHRSWSSISSSFTLLSGDRFRLVRSFFFISFASFLLKEEKNLSTWHFQNEQECIVLLLPAIPLNVICNFHFVEDSVHFQKEMEHHKLTVKCPALKLKWFI